MPEFLKNKSSEFVKTFKSKVALFDEVEEFGDRLMAFKHDVVDPFNQASDIDNQMSIHESISLFKQKENGVDVSNHFVIPKF